MSPKDEGASASTASSLETAQPTVPSLRPQPETEVKEASEAGGASSAAVSGASGEEDRGQDGKKKKNRCGVCKKKVGLTGFTCRCGGLFCSIHRYSDKHECKFDYKVRTNFITSSNNVKLRKLSGILPSFNPLSQGHFLTFSKLSLTLSLTIES